MQININKDKIYTSRDLDQSNKLKKTLDYIIDDIAEEPKILFIIF